MTTDISPRVRDRSHRERTLPISLIRGGSFYRVQEKARLVQAHSWTLHKRVPFAVAVAWLPMVILAFAHGGWDDLRPLLTDYRVYARVFIAIPLLLLAQVTMDVRFREVGQHFLDANIIRIQDLHRFREIVQKTRRLRDAVLPEVIVIVLVYLQVAYFLQSNRLRYAA